MNEKIKKSIEILEKENVKYKLVELPKSGITSKSVKEMINVKLEDICKTIVLTDGNKNFVAGFLQSNKNIDLEKMKKIFNFKEIRLARAKELKEFLCLAPGEVCPLLLKIPIVFDSSVLKKEMVHLGSGDIHYDLELNPKDLLKLVNAKIENISE
ncbi:MAG: YbaK/EbsC family protein [Nitrososphaerales archaeon]